MAAATLRQQEGIGLIVALAAHGVLFTALALWQPKEEPIPLPQTVSVTLADETSLVATSPDPSADPAPATAPMAGDSLPPPAPEPLPTLEPRPVPQVSRVVPTPPRPAPRPVTRPTPKRDPIAVLLDRRPNPAAKPPPKSPTRTATRTTTSGGRPTERAGAPDFAGAFGKGVPGATGSSRAAPAAATGAQKSSWSSLIGSKVLRFWNACSINGLEVEKLRVDVRFTLAADGSIQSIADPVVLPASITPANRTQVAPFKACAVKAIKLAAPFAGLPPEYHNDWKLRVLRLRIQ